MSDGTNTQTDECCGTRTVIVTNRDGLHARPCLVIVNAVARLRAKVTIQKGSRAVDAASILDLMLLAATQGTELVLSATGPDATEALETVVRLFDDEFGVSYIA